MEGLTLESLKRDREQIQTAINNMKIQLTRFDGVLGYLNDNIKALEEKKCLEQQSELPKV